MQVCVGYTVPHSTQPASSRSPAAIGLGACKRPPPSSGTAALLHTCEAAGGSDGCPVCPASEESLAQALLQAGRRCAGLREAFVGNG